MANETIPVLCHSFPKRWGAGAPNEDGCLFRLWAPDQDRLTLRLEGRDYPMTRREDGWFEIHVAGARAGNAYGFVLADGLLVPDPAARAQAQDQHGFSLLVDPARYQWQDAGWKGRPWHEIVLYELHIGAFTPEGTFQAAADRLEELAQLGITAVEIMPVAHFPGERNWGYDGVFAYAPHRDYGSPADMKAFVEKAHSLDLAVILDVVYNHFGPDGNYIAAYASGFFHSDRNTPWGAAIDYARQPVRDFFIENALYWLEEFQLDGLRFDAIDNIEDDASDIHILVELAQRVRAAFPGRHIHLTTEDVRNVTFLHERDENGEPLLYDAEWNDDFHHVAHVIATGEHQGYYGNYVDEPYRKLARALAEGYVYQGEVQPGGDDEPVGEPSGHLPPVAFINFIQNHDQIGNRAFGERLTVLARPQMVEVLTVLLLLSPQIPLLYMGEEYGETNPFYFFADLHGGLGESIRKGRREEAERFGGFSEGKSHEDIPDPLGEETLRHSVLNRDRRNAPEGQARLHLVRELLSLRQRHIVPLLKNTGGHCGKILADRQECIAVDWSLSGARLQLRVNFSDEPQAVPPVEGELLLRWPPARREAASPEKLPALSILFALG